MKGKIFNAQKIQAMIAGNAVMFREVIKVQPTNEDQVFGTTLCSSDKNSRGKHHFINPDKTSDKTEYFKCPYKVGQKIFCKESFNLFAGQVCYKQSLVNADKWLWKPAQRMKQEYSRLTLLIKEIRVEKLDSITPFDCVCEGVWDGRNVMLGMSGKAIEAFKDAWNATHKKPEEKFEASPFVWVFSFEVVK